MNNTITNEQQDGKTVRASKKRRNNPNMNTTSSGKKKRGRKKKKKQQDNDIQVDLTFIADDVTGDDLSGSNNNNRIVIQPSLLLNFNFNSCATGTKLRVKLSYAEHTDNGPIMRVISLYVVTGIQNGPIGLYYNGTSNLVSETASLKVFRSLDCKTMSGQYVILSEEIPSSLLHVFSEKIISQIDYFIEFRDCCRGDSIRIPPCVVTSVEDHACGNTQALGLELLSSFGIEVVLYSGSLITKEQEQNQNQNDNLIVVSRSTNNNNNNNITASNNNGIVSSPSDFNTIDDSENRSFRSSFTNGTGFRKKFNNFKTFLTSDLALQVDAFSIPRYTVCQDFSNHIGLHYSYFKNIEQMIWRSLLAGSIVLNVPPGMEEEQINSISCSAYEPFSQDLAMENKYQLEEEEDDEDANVPKIFENHLYSTNLSDEGVVELFIQPGEIVRKNQLCALVHSNNDACSTKRMLSIIDGVVTAVSVKTHYAYGELIACISKEKKIVDKMIRSSSTTNEHDIANSTKETENEINGRENGNSKNSIEENDLVVNGESVEESYESDASEEF